MLDIRILLVLFMKMALILTLAISLLSASMAFAADGTKTKATKKAPTIVEKDKKTQTASVPAAKGGTLQSLTFEELLLWLGCSCNMFGEEGPTEEGLGYAPDAVGGLVSPGELSGLFR